MKRLTVRRSAEQELASAARWYEGKQPGLGGEHLDAIETAFRALREAPEAYPTWQGTVYRKHILPRFPYIVFYVVDDEEVEVVAVAHGRRRPGYWLPRDR